MKRLFFLFTLLFILINGTRASHDGGCDISYTCIGGNDYIITLTFYRDCSGIAEDNMATINFTSSCGNFSDVLQKAPPPNGLEITPVCPSAQTTCSGGSLYGVRKWVYQGQVTLTPCADWTMSWSLCCRNTSTTLVNPTSAYLYIEAHLDNSHGPNSSPIFINSPTMVICNGQYFCLDQGAIEPDGDSLVYSLVTPFDRGPGGVPEYVTYISPYSAQNPLDSYIPVYMDASTGKVCIKPSNNLITVLDVLVQEYRHVNNVPTLIGSVLRDMQLNVLACSNHVPTLAGINPLATQYNANDSVYSIDICAGDTVDFPIYAQDSDLPAQNLTMAWNNGIPPGDFNIMGNGTHNPVGHFFWVPGDDTINSVPYCFTVSIRDDNCPYVGTKTFSYCITILGITVDFGLPQDTVLCKGESMTVIGYGDTNVVNYHWTLDGNTVIPTINDSTYIINTDSLLYGVHHLVLSVDNGILTQCPGTDYINIDVGPYPLINLGADTAVCPDQTVTLTAGGNYITCLWSTGAMANSIVVDSSNVGTGTKTVYVWGSDAHGCTSTDTINITFDCLSINELPFENSITVFPNPANDQLYINSAGIAKNEKVFIYDIQGQLLLEQAVLQTKTEIIISKLSKGLYYLRVENEEGVVVRKFVKE